MRAVALACLLTLASGCAFELTSCVSDEDCPTGTTCGQPTGTDAAVCLTVVEELGGADASPVDDDAGSRSDIAAIPWPDEGSPDVRTGDADVCPMVTDCGEAEPNDTEDRSIYLSRFAQGCSGFDLEEWSALHQDSVCRGDVDQFTIEYVACEDGAFKITVSLTTPEYCTAGGDLRIEEGLYRCGDSNVRCEVVDDAERITVIIYEQPYPQPVEKIRFAVRPGLAPDGVDYILRATIGR